jgi:dTDP-4-amino-4,6-dideoxygalactose transaminase
VSQQTEFVAAAKPVIGEEEIEAAVRVLRSGMVVQGPEVAAFEAEFAEYLGVRHVIGVANGTDAITIALRATGVAPGDEVVVPSFTFYATVEAVVNAGAVPVFCDVEPGTRNISAETVREVLTRRSRAIVAVDLFGVPAPIPELREFGLPVLEDAAQAAGASLDGRKAGALGDVGTFSFYPSKNLGCFGDGGAIATDDDRVAELARALRFHGSTDKRTFTYVGYNSRLDEIQAAVLRVLLPELDGWCEGRRAAARAYEQSGLGETFFLPRAPEAAWHLYVLGHPRADELVAELGRRSIGSRGYYRTPLHRQPAMAPYAARTRLPATDEIAATNFALPMGPALTLEQAQEVVGALGEACAALGEHPAPKQSKWGRVRDG